MPFSQIIPPSPSPAESKKSKVVSHIRHLTEMVWKQITLYKI